MRLKSNRQLFKVLALVFGLTIALGLVPKNTLRTLWGLGMKRSGRCVGLRVISGFFLSEIPLRKDGQANGKNIHWKNFGALKSQGVEVLNAGVASYCPTTERVKLRKLLVKQSLKVERVVLCLDI